MESLYKPYMPQALPELNNILHSGALAYGQWGRKFEASLKNFIGCREDVLIVNSFTAAIQVMLATIGIKEGDEVIASPQCCMASTAPIASYGAKLVWVDIDPNRGTLCPESVREKITPRTKIIMHNHHCGYPGYIDEINAIGKSHGIVVVDDAIEAFGSQYKGKLIGNLGTDITLLSFQTIRLPNTIDGGGIIFKDTSLYHKALRVRDLGVDRTTFRDSFGEINPMSDIELKGYGVTMNELCSYIGFSQMQDIQPLIDIQRKNAHSWEQRLKNHGLRFLGTENTTPSYWVFGLLSEDKLSTVKSFRELGYTASGVHIPNTYYSVFGQRTNMPPGVKQFYDQFVAIPSGWWVENL